MKVSAILPWFGGKRTLAPEIVRELGTHSAYWEPFCGSMAVLLAKPPCGMETVNDLHQDLVNLARIIRDPVAGSIFYRTMRRMWMNESEFNAMRNQLRNQALVAAFKPDQTAASMTAQQLHRAINYFATSWQGMNGLAGTARYNNAFAKRYTKNGGGAAKRWESAVDSIPAWRRRMRNLTILDGCGIELLTKIADEPGHAIYVDPPYLAKGAEYEHDLTANDHRRLAEALDRFEYARVVVSYYDHPELAKLYPRWSIRRFDMSKALAAQGKRGENDARAPEVLLLNGPSHVVAGCERLPDVPPAWGRPKDLFGEEEL